MAAFIGESYFLPGLATGFEAETEVGRLELADPHIGEVDVLIRPESISISLADDDDALAGTVIQREYYGRYQSLSVRLRSGTVLRVTGGPAMSLRLNDPVRISSYHPLMAFPGEPSS